MPVPVTNEHKPTEAPASAPGGVEMREAIARVVADRSLLSDDQLADRILALSQSNGADRMREALEQSRMTLDALRRGRHVDLTGAVERCDAALADQGDAG